MRYMLLASGLWWSLFATAGRAQTAADEFYDPAEMEASRRAVREEMGGHTTYFVKGDRLEFQTREGEPLFLWDAQGWVGGDLNKFWVKTEGEYLFGASAFEDAGVEALFSRAITPFFDVQAGVRHDFDPEPSRTFAVIGLNGLAPYLFEIDAALFVSGRGDVAARIEAEYELLITQRLILQPRTELDFALQDTPALGIGSGLSKAEMGLRLRFEIKREIAPYIGVSWTRAVGGTADFVRAAGEDVGSISFVAGISAWY